MNDWNFDIKKTKDTSNLPKQVKKKKPVKIHIDESRIGHVSRSRMAKDFKQKEHLKQIKTIGLLYRSFALILDLAIFVAIAYFLFAFKLEQVYDLYKSILFSNGFSQTVAKPIMLLYLQYAIILCSYLITFLFPIILFKKSIGKVFLGIKIIHDDVEIELSRKLVLYRELIKLISIVSIIGLCLIFFTKKKKTLHDLICETNLI